MSSSEVSAYPFVLNSSVARLVIWAFRSIRAHTYEAEAARSARFLGNADALVRFSEATMALVSRLRRASIIVTNLDRSLRLYRDVFGLTVTWETLVNASERDHAVFKLLGITPVNI